MIDSLNMVIDAAIREVLQRLSQPAHLAVNDDFLMGIDPTPGRPVAAEQAHADR